MGAKWSRSGPQPHRHSDHHLLRGALASELVAQADIRASDVVVEIGAGTGRLTAALVATGARIIAIELDEARAAILRRRFGDGRDVHVVRGDALEVRLPVTTFRAFGNIPFGVTTSILRRLLDEPAGPLRRADLIVQYDVARKRSLIWPSDLLSIGWLPWWRFELVRRLPRTAFEPPPAVDGAMLSITRRRPPLLSPERRSPYVALVRVAFRHADVPLERSLRGRLPEGAWKRVARQRGLPPRTRVRDLDVFDWTALFRLIDDVESG